MTEFEGIKPQSDGVVFELESGETVRPVLETEMDANCVRIAFG